MIQRCIWVGDDALYQRYHDEEWGVPLHDDRKLFEFLLLEGAQAGLSWITILRKRENYRKAFDDFDPQRIARYTERKVRSLLADPGIVRNERKVRWAIRNAQTALAVQEEHGSLDAYLWGLVGGRDIPARTERSDAMSKALKRRGFGFVGTTICYAFMQATGMVNDHTRDCFKHGK
jgi:DNA-3-methyladenine glycosylase I